MNKGEILAKADELVNGDRNKNYGDAKTNHQRIADMWSVILGKPVEAHEVAACMVALKLARLIETPDHLDSWVDMAGYAAIGGEIATETPDPDPVVKLGNEVPVYGDVHVTDLDSIRAVHNRAVNRQARV
ncbi:phosphofructokinase [Gordonia phage Splinter]|uniref:DUF6378 domain-containing protein n=2 Tax=Vendettavirus vendetta TaxID=2049886 RepID=A0A160DD57_9CAUD|nr:phosphofructokinase [Gordonia phage Vendetta]YP_009275426.1 phosphofructokinase [Gordonia phage Splinter]ANA85619.1 hypothetical protein PBI_VENDETTA_72 [Gordonia phage Vendetta]ANA85698.1 hypothetical protein PBI_SPLINTER_72 [Gordonia phage Splinter]